MATPTHPPAGKESNEMVQGHIVSGVGELNTKLNLLQLPFVLLPPERKSYRLFSGPALRVSLLYFWREMCTTRVDSDETPVKVG